MTLGFRDFVVEGLQDFAVCLHRGQPNFWIRPPHDGGHVVGIMPASFASQLGARAVAR